LKTTQIPPDLVSSEMIMAMAAIVFIAWLITLIVYLKYRKRSKKKIHKLLGRIAVKNHQTVKAMMVNEEKFRKLIGHMNEGLLLTDAGHKIVFANRCACSMLKVSHDKMIGRRLSDFAVGASETARLEEILNRKRSGCNAKEELQLLRGDDEIIWASLSFSYPRDMKEIIDGAIIVMVDISQHIMLERKMHKLTGCMVQKVKQLDCTFDMQQMIGQSGITADEIFQNALKIIPEGLRYGNDMRVEIVYQDKRYASPGYHETQWMYKAPIRTRNKLKGHVAVCFLGNRSSRNIQPFRIGEKVLIKNLADKLGNAPAIERLTKTPEAQL